MSNLLSVTSTCAVSEQSIQLTQVPHVDSSEDFSEDPCAIALALLTSMVPAADMQFEREAERTMVSVHSTFQALGQHFQELSKQNKDLREKLVETVKQQRSMMASHSTEIATLQQTSIAAKTAFQAMKKMTDQLPNRVQERLRMATASHLKAVQDATKAGNSQIVRLKSEYALVRTTALHAQAIAFQSDILNLKRTFNEVKTTYQIRRAQLAIEAKVAHRAYDEKPIANGLEEFRDGLRKLYVSLQFSSREMQTYGHQILLERVLSMIRA